MAEKRMFAKSVIDSDAFLDMPLTAQALYFHLGMRADDDGFVDNPKKIQRMIGASKDDLMLLIAKQFVIAFENGVVVVSHWRVHNYIPKDRYKPTFYQEELSMLQADDSKLYTSCIPNVHNLDTQIRLDQIRLDKNSIDIGESMRGEESKPKKTAPFRHKYGEYNNVLLSDEELEKLKTEFPHDWQNRIERLSEYIASKGDKYKSHLATIRSWSRKEQNTIADNNAGKWSTEHDPTPEEVLGLKE